MRAGNYEIREVRPEEYRETGDMAVEVYQVLPGMPSVEEQPEYYSMLRDVKSRVDKDSIEVLVAVTSEGEVLGSVAFYKDMRSYGSGGTASEVKDSSGIRLLAVKPEARGLGVGKSLTEECIRRSVKLGVSQVVLHTTQSMQVAWGMYERIGFTRFKEIDFMQGNLEVYGFCKSINY